jgi:CDP-glucose 4,6-dehydratase
MSFNGLAPQLSRTKKVLITGHTGFKGTWLTLLLEKLGFEVQGISLAPDEKSLYNILNRKGKIQEAYLDIRDSDLLFSKIATLKPSYVFHLAAQPLVMQSYKQPLETFATNVMGTAHLLDALFKIESAEAIVVSTTDKVYKNTDISGDFKEEDPLFGKDPYSASKVGTESVVAAWQQINSTMGGPGVCAVRAGNVIGGGDLAADRLVPDLIRSISDGKRLLIRNPLSTRPWQHALDPLLGYLFAMNALVSGQCSPAYNFGPTESSLPVMRVIEIFESVLGKLNYEILLAEKPNLEALTLNLDSNKAISELNWKPAWDQEAAIRETLTWWLGYMDSSSNAQTLTESNILHRLSS